MCLRIRIPLFGADALGGPPLRLFCKARVDKVLIECKGCSDTQLLHDEEGDAVRERVIFILVALEIRPPFVEERRIDVDEMHGRALHKVVPHLDGLRMLPPTVEERYDFTEDIGGCHEARQRSHDSLPVVCGRLMVLVTGNLQRQQIACVHKHRIDRS